jgi:hypothetical protein
MLVNFLLMSISVLTLPGRSPAIAHAVTVLPSRRLQVPLAALGVVVLTGFLAIHTWKDLSAPVSAWYLRSTPLWLIVLALASLIFLRKMRSLRSSGVNIQERFSTLPPE